MKKKIKKAFTLVELLVVIAILAILATVSIVGYNSFTKKAKVSNDTVLVKQMNDVLLASSITDGNNTTMTDALNDVFDGGYDLTKLTPTTTNYNIMWDSKNDQMVLADESLNLVYPDSSSVSTDKEDLFVVVKNNAELTTRTAAGYSVYLHDDFDGTNITVNAGVDTGINKDISSVTYENTANAQNVVIRTNSGFTNLTIKGKEGTDGDTVKHYGTAANVAIDSIGSHSYHEFGSCNEFTLNKGNAVIEGSAVIMNVKSVSSDATIENKNGKIFKVDATGTTIKAMETFKISTLEELKSYRDYWNDNAQIQGLKVELDADIKLDDGWTPIGVAARPWYGTFDGNGHTISNLNDKGYVSKDGMGTTSVAANTGTCYGFFGIVGGKTDDLNNVSVNISNLKLSDINISSDKYMAVGGLIGADIAAAKSLSGSNDIQNTNYNGNISITNITTSGNITSNNSSGATISGILGKIYTGSKSGSSAILNIENCTNNTTLNASSNSDKDIKLGGILGYSKTLKINLISCINNGNINVNSGTGYFGGIMSYTDAGNDKLLFIKDCKNTATMTINESVTIKQIGYLVCRFAPAEGMNCSISGAKIIATLKHDCNVSDLNENNFYAYDDTSKNYIKEGKRTLATKNQ